MARYLPRLADDRLAVWTSELSVVSLVGARATGKTTTARQIARTVVRLDRDAEAAAFKADPDIALSGLEEPVLLDEWQEVPGVLGAVKRAVDEDPRPGRFLLAGSVRAEIDSRTWPGTGRLVRLNMHGLTEREIEEKSGPLFLERLLSLERRRSADLGQLQPSGAEDLRTYVSRAVRGGFPEPALRLSEATRRSWLESYVDQIVTRDATHLRALTSPQKLGRYLEAVALNAAGVVHELTLIEAAGVNRKTAQAYERLLSNLFVLDVVPAWHSNRLSRLIKTPKRYLSDPSLLAAIGHMTGDSIMRNGDFLGRILDNFVYAQLRAECDVLESSPRIFHLRDEKGRHEVDLLVEFGGDLIVGIEVKATASPSRTDARHLEWLRDKLGDRFIAGVVLHTGPRAFPISDRVFAAPISTLWA